MNKAVTTPHEDYCYCKAQHWKGSGCIAEKPFPSRTCADYFRAVELERPENIKLRPKTKTTKNPVQVKDIYIRGGILTADVVETSIFGTPMPSMINLGVGGKYAEALMEYIKGSYQPEVFHPEFLNGEKSDEQ